MLGTAITFLCLGALFGAFLAFRHLISQPPKVWIALLHGPLGVTGFIILIVMLFQGKLTELLHFPKVLALPFLGLGICFGLLLLFGHKLGKKLPSYFILVHAAFGLSAILILFSAL